MLGEASDSRKRKNGELALDKEAKRGRFHTFMELKSRGGSKDAHDASYWDLLPFKVQERIVKESEVMEDMDKAREKAQQWQQVHNELHKLPLCHCHGTVKGLFLSLFDRPPR